MEKNDDQIAATNGHSNDRTNGQTNGHTNGQTNGHSNGHSNGQSNGHSKGKGAATAEVPTSTQVSKYKGSKAKPTRKDVDQTMGAITNLLHASNKPLPHRYGDGKQRKSIYEQKYTGIWADIKYLSKEGNLKESYKTLRTLAKHKKRPGYTDDKTYTMEYVIRLSAHLPTDSLHRLKLTALQVDQLWNTLQHPPMSLLSNEYRFRQPDGGHNNPMYPNLGRAGTSYARTVKPMTMMPMSQPDPGLVFDAVMCRREFRPHRNNVSSMLFYIASIIIHDLFQTNRKDVTINDTSSYLELSPLYGNNAEDQRKMRTFKDGKLKPDCYSEKRLLGFPPGVGVILIMFNRFHNYAAEQLAAINENGRFDPKIDHRNRNREEALAQAEAKREEELFQTARLVTCGLYINIILTDYLRTIVNLNRTNSTWTLDPRFDPSKIYNPHGTEQGTGNQVSVEFNLVYRWHSCISKRDEIWTEDLYKQIFGENVDPLNMPLSEFLKGLGQWESSLPDDPAQRTFSNMQRNDKGMFEDDDLVRILTEGIEDPCGAFGARNVPAVLRAVEIMGMEQSRKWKVASLNEFRAFFGLEPHKTFESINSNPEVADALRQLYDQPDFVELYPGLVAEEDKVPMEPGVGIAPTFTISRAILSDAVVLVRGDRFHTIDYTTAGLTNWGFQEVASDFNVLHGCVFYKLFLKCFPNHFTWNSVYAMYPLTIPEENRKIFTNLGTVDNFDYSRPKYVKPRVPIRSYAATKRILDDKQTFNMMWEGFTWVFGKPYMLSGDGEWEADLRKFIGKCIYGQQDWEKQVRQFYEDTLTRLVKEKRYKVPAPGCQGEGSWQIDAVRDVNNLAHANFAATLFGLPLKTKDNPKDFFTEQEIYQILTLVFVCIFFDVDPSKSYPLRHATQQLARQFGKLVEIEVKAVDSIFGALVSGKYFKKRNTSALRNYGIHMIKRLLESGKSAEDVTWSHILPTAGAACANQGQVFAQVLDFYLRPENAQHLAEIQRLARLDTPEADNLILRYALEGTRLAGTFGLYRRVNCAGDTITVQDDDRTVHLDHGDRVFVSFISASTDSTIFPDPHAIRLDRPEESYIQYGSGPHQCLGMNINKVSFPTMLKFFGKLKNLRRAPGIQGELKAVEREGKFKVYLREDWSGFWPFPVNMKVRFDGVEGWEGE
ncbi:heme peroxidase [Kalaharituber pfeilii]|nr:heme peroxidase [Kalaharituber pfeilii]